MRAYQDMVYSTAARLLGDDAQAQDVAQEVFLKAYENFEQLRCSATIGGWLKTVATHLCLNHLTRYRKRWALFSDLRRAQGAEGAEGDEDDARTERELQNRFAVPDILFEGIDAAERARTLERALRALPEQQRVPLVLYHFEEMSYQDIARQLRVSLAKVKSDILRARIALARLLSPVARS
jgi:RNA polymerase sigma-70 factor (ECF subfamily)